MPQRHATSAGLVAAALAAAAALPGCTRRTIEVTSTPPGAVVWLNDQQVGRTPVAVDFTHFGNYDVRLKLDGYEPISTNRRAAAPLHEVPPIDLPASALPIHHRVVWHFDLVAATPPAPAALIDRAAALRRQAAAAGPSPQSPGGDAAGPASGSVKSE